jgi:hypothetical protein
MSRRVFVFIIALICFLGTLLLLSALIESPAAPDVVAEEPPVAHTISAYVSMPPTPECESVTSSAAWLRVAALFAFVIVIVPCVQCACDANGRVLKKRRYVRCYHLVFKQEVACG